MRIALLALCVTVTVVCATHTIAAQGNRIIYITPTSDDFHTYLSAAIQKKKVPVSVTIDKTKAHWILEPSQVAEQQVTTGHKVVNCLFASCAGNEDKARSSVQLIDNNGTIVWSYAVNKARGAKNRQSMAEAIAKHLNDDFLKNQH